MRTLRDKLFNCRRGLAQTFIGLGLIFTLLTLTQPALAIGPGTGGSKIRVGDERVGPFTLLVATSPLPVTIGQMSVWVRVTDNQTAQLQRDAVVRVEARPREGGSALMAEATHKNAGNDYDYVAHLEVPQAGQWDVTVVVEDEAGAGEVSFVETVTYGLSAGLLVAVAIPFVVLAAIIGVYLWRRGGIN